MKPINWREYIVSSLDVLRGKPRIKGTRIPVSLILGYLAAGNTHDQILQEFPDLQKEQIAACLDYARDLADFETVAS
ncbi:DUF433 domain-containing protein [Phormidesmis priestleyi ULC007]|uniref:DUF433 domain-containing protein n=1 Tax=Phormidesmis priestleyi ULC007 TaxID=1920490 RepID=A0A2T1DHZ6_9CYAN|nr:DUF433 domain-containing protein [Phormidesmis priestleyi]PSB20129.1 DUF433 domain-containing protein [Phormidesmis priestleyi ULC007]PZO49058.1 MAG: DUF433 domain-containing protein [Phormidesmis priestleyi]